MRNLRLDCVFILMSLLQSSMMAALVISEFVMGGVGERKLDLSLAFAERKNERKIDVLVSVVDKPTEIDWDSL